MRRLLNFIYKNRTFILFVFLEILCALLIVQNNRYQSSAFYNSSNYFIGSVYNFSDNVKSYFSLSGVNEDLAEENAQLRKLLEQKNQSLFNLGVRENRDPELLQQYEYVDAKVINNSTRWFDNYITIDKGKKHGLEPGMGVINSSGIVGKVKSVSRNYSVVNSMLHSKVIVSSKIKRTGDLCSTQWNGKDPYEADLFYVPKHVQLQIGDTVITSGHNAVFPAEMIIGTVKDINSDDEDLFYEVSIRLANDFNALSYVYVVKNRLKVEKDSLENISGVNEQQ
ncbi:MAG: rod shape-determining protein MreC [Bacteroidota bacterium]